MSDSMDLDKIGFPIMEIVKYTNGYKEEPSHSRHIHNT